MVSVIVPVYNTEKYLNKCIQSILLQTYKDFELILVDDGSTDQSLMICNDYARNASKVKVFSQKNGGQNAAIKKGIENCNGDLICFVDSDDWIEHNMLYRFVQMHEKYNADCVICRTCRDNELSMPSQQAMKKEIYCLKDIYECIYPSMFCSIDKGKERTVSYARIGKLYKKETLKKVIPYMDETVRHGEDSLLSLPYVLMCNNICYINDVLYHYRRNEGSISYSKRNTFEEQIKVVEILKKAAIELSEYDFSNQFKGMLLIACLNQYHYIVHNIGGNKELYLAIKDLCNSLNDKCGIRFVPYSGNIYWRAELIALNMKKSWMLFLLAKIRNIKHYSLFRNV